MKHSGQLSVLKVTNAMEPGMYGDGSGLWLQLKNGGKSWVFRFRSPITKKARVLGLGPVRDISLAEARERAAGCRRVLQEGKDPIEEKKASLMTARVEAAKGVTFTECASAYIDANRSGWSNPKHAQQWTNTLAKYVYPTLGNLPVVAVDTSLVIRCLEPIWTTKSETASRVRGRIEAVLDYAATREFRQGENPARWKGHLSNILPAKRKVSKVEHHSALDYRSVPAFLVELRQHEGMAALALELAILTATRTSETLNVTWGEIDMKSATWTIPAERMKGRREHRVPLSKTAIANLEKAAGFSCTDCAEDSFVFPGQRPGRPLSNMALLMLLRRMDRVDLTTHGFRSSFRDWGAETTNYPNELLEMALAHSISDKAEAAYRRGDLFSKRRKLMESWTDFIDGKVIPSADIIPMRNMA